MNAGICRNAREVNKQTMISSIATGNKIKFSKKEFETLCRRIYDLCGINLSGKNELVEARLSKRVSSLNLTNYAQYFKYVDSDYSGKEQIWMIDALTTNKTSFYREIQHFDFLRQRVLPTLNERKVRIWSAACSTGEEPYSIAVQLREELPQIESRDVKILATDISTKVLRSAHEAVYQDSTLEPVPKAWRQKYFNVEDATKNTWRVVPEVRRMVRFARLNFLESFPMKGPFDVIFCRNAMIYFDKPTQTTLVNRFYDLIKPGGFLFVGHSESLNGAPHNFKYIQPATYQK